MSNLKYLLNLINDSSLNFCHLAKKVCVDPECELLKGNGFKF